MNRNTILLLVLLGGVVAAHAQFDTNLILNGSAETFTGTEDGVVDFADWTRTGGIFADRYETFPVTYLGAGPSGVGGHYFLGGTLSEGSLDGVTSLTQAIDLSFAATTVDSASARFDLSAWLIVRDQDQDPAFAEDTVALWIRFFSASASLLGTSSIGPYDGNRYAGDAALFNKDVGFFESRSGLVPVGARSAVVSQIYVRRLGSITNTGMDLVTLKLQAVPEPATLAALGLGALALLRRRRR